jgi:Uma2 family endonuclease
MSTVSAPTYATSALSLPPPENCYRLTVEQYHEMAAAGILRPEHRVELIEGVLVRKMTIYPPHSFAVDSLDGTCMRMNVPGWCYRAQQPVTLADGEPEPDGAWVRGSRSDYAGSHPAARSVGLVIEAADSSLSQDRGVKKRSYARAGIPRYWIVNLIARVVEVYADPAGEDYRGQIVLKPRSSR